MTQKLLPGTVKTRCLYKTGHRAEHRTEAGASFMLFILKKDPKTIVNAVSWQPTQEPTGFRYGNCINRIENLFSGLHVEAKEGDINSSLWKPKINAS